MFYTITRTGNNIILHSSNKHIQLLQMTGAEPLRDVGERDMGALLCYVASVAFVT